MADEQLGAELDLDIAGALGNVDTLGSAIEAALAGSVDSFSELMSTAVATVPDVQVETDTSDVGPAITDAITGADLTATIDPEADAVTTDIDAAVQAADTGVVLDTVGAELITGDIDAAIGAADTMVPVDADTTDATSMVDLLTTFIDNQAPTIEVDADTSEAQAAADDLSASLSGVADSSSAAGSGMSGASHEAAILGGAAGVATGEVGGLKEVAHGAGLESTAAALGVTAMAGATAEFFHEGVAAVGAGQRFNAIVGDMADKVKAVHVGDLSAEVGDLGIKFGSTDAEMQNAISSVFQFGVNGGMSRDASAQFSNELVGLAARAISLNPNLGSLSDVTEQMALRMARGGRFAATFGLSLSSAEINTRALAESGKESAGDLTIQEKSFAAAQIAAERYGNGLNDTVTKGASNAQNVEKSLMATVKETVETFGTPIVIPMFDLIRAGLPVVESLGSIVSTLATSAIPVLTSAVTIVNGPLHLLADVMDALGPAITPALYAFLAFKAIEFLPQLFYLMSGAALTYSEAELVAADSAGVLAVESAAAGLAIEGALGPIGWVIAAVSLGAAAFGLFGGSEDDASKSTKELKDALVDANGALDEHVLKVQRSALEHSHQTDDLIKAGVSFSDYTDAIHTAGGATDAQADKLRRYAVSLVAGTSTNAQFVAALREISPELGKMGAQLDRSGQLNDGLKQTIVDQVFATRDATQATKERSEAGSTDTDITKGQAAAVAALAASALPALADGEKSVAAARQTGVTALTDGVAALARYESGSMSLTDTETALKAAQDALNAAVLGGDVVYASSAAAALANKAALDETAASLITSVTPLAAVTEGTRAHAAELAAQQQQLDNGAGAMGRYTDGTLSAKEATDALDGAANVLKSDLDLLLGRYLSADEATNNYQLALLKLDGELGANGNSFDAATEAGANNRNTLDGVAEKAISASDAIEKQTGNVQAALAPLQGFRDHLVTLRDAMATAGQDTSFIDGMLGQVDGAIAGINARDGDAAAAGAGQGQAYADGVGSKKPEAETAGGEIGTASYYGARNHKGDHTSAGTEAGDAYAGGVSDTTGASEGSGAEIGAASYYGASTHVGDHSTAGTAAGGAYAGGVRGQTPNGAGAGSELGAASYYGASTHVGDHSAAGSASGGAYAGGVGSQQGNAAGAGAGLGAAGAGGAGSGGDWFGEGASTAAGFAAGISSVVGRVIAAAQSVAGAATQAIHDWISNPPYPSRVGQRLGASLGTGFAVGLGDQADAAAAYAEDVANAALTGLMPEPPAWSAFTPSSAVRNGYDGGAAASVITFDIDVHGVSDPTMARTVGEQIGEGASDALARRGYTTTARLG